MTQEIGDEINALLQELAGDHLLQERQPGDVDSEMLVKTTGYGLKYCEEILRKKAQEGLLEKIYVLGADGHRKIVYRKVKNENIT